MLIRRFSSWVRRPFHWNHIYWQYQIVLEITYDHSSIYLILKSSRYLLKHNEYISLFSLMVINIITEKAKHVAYINRMCKLFTL